jgi:glycosyltransferase involved in cell wall biosynthesis
MSGRQEVASPTFSVLVATYNQAEYVLETLDTVAAQRSSAWELVVVNDGSTDGTEERVRAWVEEFQRSRPNRVVFESIPNSGQSAAMEHGFALCGGRYIALLDSDDRWLPEKLEVVARAAEADPDAGMIMHPLLVIDSAGRRTGDVRPKRAALPTGDLREQVRRTSRLAAPATSGVVIRADVFRRLVPMPTRRFKTAADLYLTLGAGLLAPVRSLPQPLAEYRMHPGGQHIRTMLSAEGVRYWVELQGAIAEHFGLQEAAGRNAYFLRQDFALAKLDAGVPRQLQSYLSLARATWRDEAFPLRDRLLFNAYWTACMLAPRPLFRSLWRTYQLKQTGFDRIGLEGDPAPNAGAVAGAGGA